MPVTLRFTQTAAEASASPVHQALAVASKGGDYRGADERVAGMTKPGKEDPNPVL